jgi:hypothetical protein
LDLTGEGLEQVKNAIIKRIELQPSLTKEQKDKIFASIQAAKAMGRIAVVTFNTASSNPLQDVANIESQINQPQVKKIMNEQRIVLVVLVMQICKVISEKFCASTNRAQTVLQILRDRCGF